MSTPAPLSGTGRVAGAAALIAVLTVASRLAGFGRTAVLTWVVGDRSDLGDIYLIANTVPNIIFEIVAGGALASLVVPLLAGAVVAGDRAAVSATTGALLTWTMILLVPLALAVTVLAGPIISLIANDPTPAELAAGTRMLRIFAPQLPLYGIGIVLTGVLQAHQRFAWPVIAPLLSSLTVIAAYLTFASVEGRELPLARVSLTGELILSVGTTLGVVVLSLCLLIPLRRLRLRIRPGYRFTTEVRQKIGGLALAGAVTVAGQQVALLVALKLADGGPAGTVVVYNVAQTVYLLPWAVLAVPLASAAYPTLAAARASGDEDGYRRTLAPTTRAVLLFSCLGAAALIATAEPIAGFFPGLNGSTAAVAGIIGFAPGLLGYGLFAVLSRALYARGDTRAAAAATAGGWLVVPVAAVLLSAAFPIEDRVLALTLANSVGMLLLGGSLVVVVIRRAGRAALAGIVHAGAVGVLAGSAAMTVGLVVNSFLGHAWQGTPTQAGSLIQGMLSGIAVGTVFLAVAYPLDRHDVRPLILKFGRRLRRLMGRGRAAGPDGSGQGRGEGKETVSG
ncbi:lipid II flippase MurJ [Micromonospora sonneratiae]|uniref:Murein biosynthesis integral membrane protein MurJ n=1 Tax=Micromonospora sonneratiae TaxID=1184706 RepID=A0ABW3YS80_9ACTN